MYKYENSNYSNTINKLLIDNIIRISDLPFEVRTYKRSFYITALRVSRGISPKRLIEDLSLLCSDIDRLEYLPDKKEDKHFFIHSLLCAYTSSIDIIADFTLTKELTDFLIDIKNKYSIDN